MEKILLLNVIGSILFLTAMTIALYVIKDIQGRLEMKRELERLGQKVRFRDIH